MQLCRTDGVEKSFSIKRQTFAPLLGFVHNKSNSENDLGVLEVNVILYTNVFYLFAARNW